MVLMYCLFSIENKKASRRHSGSRFMITNKSGENISSEENSNTGNNTNHSPSTSSPLERSRSSSLQKKLNEGALTVSMYYTFLIRKYHVIVNSHSVFAIFAMNLPTRDLFYYLQMIFSKQSWTS